MLNYSKMKGCFFFTRESLIFAPFMSCQDTQVKGWGMAQRKPLKFFCVFTHFESLVLTVGNVFEFFEFPTHSQRSQKNCASK